MLPHFREYPLTSLLIGINFLVYIWLAVTHGSLHTFHGDELLHSGGVFGPAVVVGGEWWRLLTAMFLHGGLEHIGLNMFSLFIVGRVMERYLEGWVYLLLYFLSGIVGFIFSIYAHPESVSIGASGAIFGIFGAVAGFAIAKRHYLGREFRAFMQQFGIIVAINIGIGIAIPAIDLSAHIGGLIIGVAGGYIAGNWYSYFIYFVLVISVAVGWLGYSVLPGLYPV